MALTALQITQLNNMCSAAQKAGLGTLSAGSQAEFNILDSLIYKSGCIDVIDLQFTTDGSGKISITP